MHVAVARQDHENQPSDELLRRIIPKHRAKHFGDAREAYLSIFIFRKNPKDLRQILI